MPKHRRSEAPSAPNLDDCVKENELAALKAEVKAQGDAIDALATQLRRVIGSIERQSGIRGLDTL